MDREAAVSVITSFNEKLPDGVQIPKGEYETQRCRGVGIKDVITPFLQVKRNIKTWIGILCMCVRVGEREVIFEQG